MKYSTLALTLASILSVGAASATTIYKHDNGDNLKIYGGAEIGGTIVSDTDKSPFGAIQHDADGNTSYDGVNDKRFVNDSFLTLGIKGQTDDFYAKFELDAEHQDWTETNSMRVVIDKAYVGYKLPMKGHTIEFGRTDTAYDHYDAFGDFANELSAEVSEAGDQDETLKYRGQFDQIKFGLSHSLEGWDVEHKGKTDYVTDSREGAVTNGYVGYFDNEFTVIAAAETVDDRGEIFSVHAKVNLGDLAVGGFVSYSDREADNKDSYIYVASAKYSLTDKLALLATGNMVDADNDKNDAEWIVVGGEYKYAKNIKLAAEISIGDVLKHGESGALGYVKAYYWF